MNSKKITAVAVVIIAFLIVGYAVLSMPKTAQAPAPSTATSSPTSITQADNGKTVTFAQGSRFLLNLGDMDWTLSFSDPNIVKRVVNIMVIRSAQGIYTATAPGTTVLTAEGRPHCAPGEMCAQYIVQFKVTIEVRS